MVLQGHTWSFYVGDGILYNQVAWCLLVCVSKYYKGKLLVMGFLGVRVCQRPPS